MSSSGLRLRGELHGAPVRLDIAPLGGVLGTDPTCDFVLQHATISRRHAELRAAGEALEVRDLGSTNGTWVENQRVEQVRLTPGQAVLFGRVRLVLESVARTDHEVALPLPGAPRPETNARATAAAQTPPTRSGAATVSVGPLDALMTEELAGLLRLLHRGAAATQLAHSAGAVMTALLPVGELEIHLAHGGLLFQGRGGLRGKAPAVLERQHGEVTARATFAHESVAGSLASVLECVALLIDLARPSEARAASVERPPPAGVAPALPAPASVEPEVREIYSRAARVGQGNIGVLILGESGTGKEVLARYLHEASTFEHLVPLNCAALPRDLLEAELFGVEKGTATGVQPRPGKMELAHDGTLFLDEIGDMSLETQAKILRVLQEGEVYRLGASRPRAARARLIAATNKDVEALMAAGHFRRDLYHRIASWVVELPPLRRRPGDIPNLAVHFLAREGQRLGRHFRGISRGALDALLGYAWPGNIRQLQQELARCALFMDDGDVLEAAQLATQMLEAPRTERGEGSLPGRLERYERQEIQRALDACGGQVGPTAEHLGVHRATLYRRMKTLGIAGVKKTDP